jgi:hypothetical protein
VRVIAADDSSRREAVVSAAIAASSLRLDGAASRGRSAREPKEERELAFDGEASAWLGIPAARSAPYSASPTLAGIVGALRACTALTISALSIPCR